MAVINYFMELSPSELRIMQGVIFSIACVVSFVLYGIMVQMRTHNRADIWLTLRELAMGFVFFRLAFRSFSFSDNVALWGTIIYLAAGIILLIALWHVVQERKRAWQNQ